MADERKDSGSDEGERRDSDSDEGLKVSSGSKERETSCLKALMEDQKLHGMVVAVGIGLAVLIAFITFTLFTAPPHQPRRKPPPVPAVREYTVRDYSRTRKVPAERRQSKKPSPEESYDEDKRRKKISLASQLAVPMKDFGHAKVLNTDGDHRGVQALPNVQPPAQIVVSQTDLSHAKMPNTEVVHKGVQAPNLQVGSQMVFPNVYLSHAKMPNTDMDHRGVQALPNLQVGSQMVFPKSDLSRAKMPNTDVDHKGVQALQNLQVGSQIVLPNVAHVRMAELEPIDTIPAQPVVCVVSSSATVEVSYPQDGLCDAVIFNKVFYHQGVVYVSQTENHTYHEFLVEAAKSKLTAYMVATDRYFAVYQTISAALNLEALRKQNVRGFGFLGIRVQSAQGVMLEQHSKLLQSQVQDLNNMLREVDVTDCALFLGVTTEEHMFKDDIATTAFKLVVKSVRVHLLIIENNQLKHDDCLGSPITMWTNESSIAFDEAQATAAWMTQLGISPALSHTAVAFSSWIPAMQFIRSADTTVPTVNGTRRCFVFSLSPYDKMVCSHPRRYHNVSDMYFAKDESMQGVYVYDDPEILKEKVMKVRRAMSGTTSNVGWAFYGLEYEGNDAGQCGHRYDRIPAVKTALRSLRVMRTT
ncbi:uncharacterized protein [Dermacentor albipictus]|uniref:uncharacterized protein isoform X2 n=1 Tax=Dermacentor albipictus TaxID=60249 RepID=UPI0038FC55E4